MAWLPCNFIQSEVSIYATCKKKNLKKPGQTHQCCNTGLNVGVTAERSYLRPWSRVPFVCVDRSNRHAIVLQIWKNIIRCSGKTSFRASFVVCVAAVSVRIRSEEQGTLSQRPLFGSRSIFRAANTENPVPRRSAVSLCSETTRKHLPHRLANHWIKFYHFCNTIAWEVHTRNSIVGDSRYKLFFEVFKLQSRSQITSLCPVKCC